jgi:hypothetical protein
MDGSMEGESLEPKLAEAQKALERVLDEARNVDLKKVNTDELMRIEETLVLASKAAKDAVSLRLKLRSERALAQQNQPAARRSPHVPGPTTVADHRIFDDFSGRRWRVVAVHPVSPAQARSAIPVTFQQGWLLFDSADQVRRVAPIPENWEQLSTDDLRELCHGAPTQTKRRLSDDQADPGQADGH